MTDVNGDAGEQAVTRPVIETPVRSMLTDEQLALLQPHGTVRPTVTGQILFREGDRSYDFIVILSGRVTIVDHHSGIERTLTTAGPSEFLVELGILTGERVFVTG